MLIFKIIDQKGVNTFNAIIVNYFTALTLGFVLSRSSENFSFSIQTGWIVPAIFIGIAFVAMFYIIALTSQKAGVSITAVSSRMSVVIPALFSIIYFGETIVPIKIAGMALAIPALVLASVRSNKTIINRNYLYLPFILFIGSGIVDSIVKYAQHEFLDNSSIMIFSALLFSVAAVIGVTVRILSKEKLTGIFKTKVIFWGILLGLVNWGSLYFFVMALINSGLDSSIVFVLNNSGIVILTTLFAIIFFREKLLTLNWIGLSMSLVVIILLSGIR